MFASLEALISAKGEIDAQTSALGTACFERESHDWVERRHQTLANTRAGRMARCALWNQDDLSVRVTVFQVAKGVADVRERVGLFDREFHRTLVDQRGKVG